MIKKNKIIFATVAKELFDENNTMPQPQRLFIPKWFKNVKSVDSGEQFNYIGRAKNVRRCPSFVEVWDEGYVIKAPTDYLLKVNEDTTYSWKTAYTFKNVQSVEDVEEHYNVQMLDFYPDKDFKKILKLQLPFRVYTPKGVSCRQMPLLFQDTKNEQWEVPQGIVRTDKVHEINIQIMIKTFDEILIKKGTPLCVYAPFVRQKFKHKNIFLGDNKKYTTLDNKNYLKMFSGFKSNAKWYWED